MGSPIIEDNDSSSAPENPNINHPRCKRPDVFPCKECGRFFTELAMAVHKRTCLENENCKCTVCMSDRKWKLAKHLNNEDVSSRNKPYEKNSAGVERDIVTNKKPDGEKTEFSPFQSEEKSDFENTFKSSVESDEMSDHEKNGRIVLKDHEYVSMRADSSENSDVSTENSENVDKSLSLRLGVKFHDHDCDRKLFCRYCDSHVFWESFGVHIIQHCQLAGEFLKCPECDRTFPQPALYLTHYLIHNSEHSLYCKACRCSFPSCIYTERATESSFAELYPHHCYICLSHFSHPQTVINHMRLHSKEMPFKCSVCSRSFRQIGNLQRHMTTHRGERPYKCPNCSSSFADPATLRNHERVHTGETPYVCPCCTRGFSQIGNLKRHIALHLQKDPSSSTFSSTIEVKTEENTIKIKPSEDIKINVNTNNESQENGDSNPEKTDIVNSSSKAYFDIKIPNGSSRRNNRKNGKLKVFTCEICKKVYTWQHDLVVHFRTHTGEKPYKCDECGKKFAQSGAVRIHKERHHSGSVVKKRNVTR